MAAHPQIGPLPQARTRSFTRRGGRMPARHHRALESHSDTYVLDVPLQGTAIADGAVLDRRLAFCRVAPLVVEIGGGAGDCIVAAAAAHPETDFLGVEVWRPGVAQTIAKAVHHRAENVRLLEADAVPALQTFLPEASVQEIWTFFPDPWPKTKHHKRRLVQEVFADAVARVLVDGGVWRLASDWAEYAEQLREVVDGSAAFDNPHPGGFAPRFEGRVMTRFERKGIDAGRVIRDVTGIRRPRDVQR